MLQSFFMTLHSMFLELWNTWKSLYYLTIIFISILDEGIVEIRKKFNSHDGLLRADQDGVKTFLPNGLNGCPILQVHKSKSHCEISISSTFFTIPSSSRHEKHYQMLERLFVLFHYTRNILWSCISVLMRRIHSFINYDKTFLQSTYFHVLDSLKMKEWITLRLQITYDAFMLGLIETFYYVMWFSFFGNFLKMRTKIASWGLPPSIR